MLTAQKVHEIFMNCLYEEKELKDKEIPFNAVVVDGINHTFHFHPERLAAHKAEIAKMIADLPEKFRDGWAFQNLCFRKDDTHWGEHRSAEQLMALGIATGNMKFVLPRDSWGIFGGLPYVFVTLPAE